VFALVRLILVIAATALGLALFTEYLPDRLDSRAELLGMPLVSIAQGGAHGWLSIGQGATGVLVFAQGGAGVVAITQVGAGVFFSTGQLAFGLLAIGQLGVGFFCYLGQLGLGAQALGQGVFKSRSKEWFRDLNAELTETLSFRSPPRQS
jgi:hypothetical protein